MSLRRQTRMQHCQAAGIRDLRVSLVKRSYLVQSPLEQGVCFVEILVCLRSLPNHEALLGMYIAETPQCIVLFRVHFQRHLKLCCSLCKVPPETTFNILSQSGGPLPQQMSN
jgi:hypothetical protein